MSAWEQLILERTQLTDVERREGAIDVTWYNRVFEILGRGKWEQMAKAARIGATSNYDRENGADS